jgi:hypothetical protein
MYKLILIILFVAIITTFLGGHEDFSENDHSFFSFLNFNSNPDIKYLRSSLFGLFQSNYSHTPTYAPVYSSTLYTPAQIPESVPTPTRSPTYAPVYSSTLYTPAQIPESVPTPTRSPAYAPVYLPPNDNQNNYQRYNQFTTLASAPAQDPSTAYAFAQAARYGSYSEQEYGKTTDFADVRVLM